MKKNHYLTLPRYKRKLHPNLLRQKSEEEILRNRRTQMIHIQERLCTDDIYRKAYNRAISMILGCQLDVQASDLLTFILNTPQIFFPWNKSDWAKYKKLIKL